tara:strand:+ start:368 stop:862 length:495 start_codon:yes stop_codon:yes gene_type:complete
MKILVCGLPGSGKTWLAKRLVKHIKNCAWYNADVLRKYANDWDFSMEGRIRQANRMKTFADFERDNGRWVVCDFVAPTEKARNAFDPNYVIWMDTIKEGRIVSSKLNELKNINNLPFDVKTLSKSKEFEDTNKIFEIPSKIDTHIKYFLSDEKIKKLAEKMLNV